MEMGVWGGECHALGGGAGMRGEEQRQRNLSNLEKGILRKKKKEKVTLEGESVQREEKREKKGFL